MKLTALVCAVVFSVVCFGASPTIGVESSLGNGETSLTAGSTLKTEGSASEVRLDNGVAVRLAPRSAGTVFGDHAVLEQGAARVSHFGGYAVQVGDLTVAADTPETQTVIRMQRETIEIASLGGPVSVTDGGAMMTRVAAGTKMSFQKSGASPATTTKKPLSETKVWLFVIGGVAVAALAIGLTAAAQGKSPF